MVVAPRSVVVVCSVRRSVGGLRVSLYNAVTVDEVQVLGDFMRSFYDTHAHN